MRFLGPCPVCDRPGDAVKPLLGTRKHLAGCQKGYRNWCPAEEVVV